MKSLDISYCNGALKNMEEISSYLNTLPLNQIVERPWPEYASTVACSFAIAYTENSLLLKYEVIERHILAIYQLDNQPVYKDSCVEFFISFPDDDNYYNLEFNCIGTCLAGYGSEKNDRQKIDESLLAKIRHQTFFQTKGDGEFYWTLALDIPFSVFEYHSIKSLKGTNCKVNFYKCGDDLPEPHFFSWNPIGHPTPNFHLPEFFGTANFK